MFELLEQTDKSHSTSVDAESIFSTALSPESDFDPSPCISFISSSS